MTITIQPRTIGNDVVVDLTIPYLREPAEGLLPHWYDRQCMNVFATLTLTDNGSYVVLTVTVTSREDSSRPPTNTMVRWVIEQIWNKLAERKLVPEMMPDIP